MDKKNNIRKLYFKVHCPIESYVLAVAAALLFFSVFLFRCSYFILYLALYMSFRCAIQLIAFFSNARTFFRLFSFTFFSEWVHTPNVMSSRCVFGFLFYIIIIHCVCVRVCVMCFKTKCTIFFCDFRLFYRSLNLCA